MRVMKFEGATMRDAIARVKAELGDQAVIIASRQVRRGLLGSAVEISAAIDDDSDHAAVLAGPTSGGPQPAPPPPPAARNDEDVEKLLAPLRSELRSLRALVRTSGEGRGTTELRAEMSALRRLVEQLHRADGDAEPPAPVTKAKPDKRPEPKPAAKRPVADTAPPHRRHDSPLTAASTGSIVMLVGPTGAGKTTTVAKLAARAALIEHRKVGMITLDNYRVGGVEQIRMFANLIGVPLAVAEGPATLARHIDASNDLTLIDTAGRSPRDRAAIEELARHIANLDIEVHLVIPAGSTAAQIDELVQRYSSLAPTRLLFTKLDEYEHAPEVALAPARTRLPITWVTTGQAVPEDLEQPSPARVLELAANGLGDPTSPRHRSPRAA